MLGHKLVQMLAARGLWVAATLRSAASLSSPAARATLGNADRIFDAVDVLRDDHLAPTIAAAKPDVVINAVGIIKQIDAANDPVVSISTNALLPHRSAAQCTRQGCRLIHLSTDCVFSGRNGPYAEDMPADPEDLYGRSKLLGEPSGPRCLTIRTSIVGRELRVRAGLVEWFCRSAASATGCQSLYSGLTAAALANRRPIDRRSSGAGRPLARVVGRHQQIRASTLINHHFGSASRLRERGFAIDRRLGGVIPDASGFPLQLGCDDRRNAGGLHPLRRSIG